MNNDNPGQVYVLDGCSMHIDLGRVLVRVIGEWMSIGIPSSSLVIG